MEPYDPIANLLKALAHPARIRILRALATEGEACVCHLEARLGLRQAYLSQQLARLRQAGVVEDRKEGLNVFYAVSKPKVLTLLNQTIDIVSPDYAPGWTDADSGSREDCPCPKCTGENPGAV